MHTSSARPMLARNGGRPNAKCDPSWSKSPLRIGNFRVGGALTRRERSPELEQITSKKRKRLAEKCPKKRARETPSDKRTDKTWVYRLGGAPILQKRTKVMTNYVFDNVHTSRVPGPCWPKRNASERPLRIGDYKVGAALARRGQCPSQSKTPLRISDFT